VLPRFRIPSRRSPARRHHGDADDDDDDEDDEDDDPLAPALADGSAAAVDE
jgi:hypothetical protein